MKARPAQSMRELAKTAGVSHVTVSRALRNDPSISVKTAQRIQELARQQGYRTNPMVSALMTQLRSSQPRSGRPTIAYLNTWWPRVTWNSCDTKTKQFAGAERRAAELGYQLESFWLHEPQMTGRRLTEVLRSRRIQGVLIGPLQDPAHVLGPEWEEFALATISYSVRTPQMHRTCHAHFRGMHRAMEELVQRGCQRIGFITSREFEQRVNSLWGAAFRLLQHTLPESQRVEPLILPRDAEIGALRKWLKVSRPDAVINALPHVYEMLQELGLRSPADLSFVHLDLPRHLQALEVTGIDQLSRVVGAAAVDQVIHQLHTNFRGPPVHATTQLIEGLWIEGKTAGPRPAASSAARVPRE